MVLKRRHDMFSEDPNATHVSINGIMNDVAMLDDFTMARKYTTPYLLRDIALDCDFIMAIKASIQTTENHCSIMNCRILVNMPTLYRRLRMFPVTAEFAYAVIAFTLMHELHHFQELITIFDLWYTSGDANPSHVRSEFNYMGSESNEALVRKLTYDSYMENISKLCPNTPLMDLLCVADHYNGRRANKYLELLSKYPKEELVLDFYDQPRDYTLDYLPFPTWKQAYADEMELRRRDNIPEEDIRK